MTGRLATDFDFLYFMSALGYIIHRTPPVNLDQKDAVYFANDFEARIPEPTIQVLENIDVTAEGLLFNKRRILLESFSQPESFANWKLRSVLIAHLRNLIRPTKEISEAVWVTDDWSVGYFHWLSDVIPKILIARHQSEDCGILLPSHLQNLDLVNESLSILGIKNISFVPTGSNVRVARLFRPIHTPVSGDYIVPIIRSVRRIFSSSVLSKGEYRRIYISRRLAKKRHIVNEGEVERILDEYDFKLVETEKMSFRQQIELFAGCEHLVSIHGAGLTNMLFMAPDTQVLELRKPDKTVPNCFFNLASALRIKYYYQMCPAVNPQEPPHSADLIVDGGLFRRNIEKMIVAKEHTN